MSALPASDPLQDANFETLEAAVMETARGRWFLNEHARRQRVSETERLLVALQRLERALASHHVVVSDDRAAYDLSRFHAAASDLAQKLDDIMRQIPRAPLSARPSQIEGQILLDAKERRRIEQRLIEPRPFLDQAG